MRDVPRWVLWGAVFVGAWLLANGTHKLGDDLGLHARGCPLSMSEAECRSLLGTYDDDAH